jgi:hypothetical protein
MIEKLIMMNLEFGKIVEEDNYWQQRVRMQ